MADSTTPDDDRRRSPALHRVTLKVLALAVLGAALLYLFATPVLTFVGRQLVHADPLQRADVMIVLAPGMDRVIEGADLYRSGYSRLVVLTTEPPEPSVRFLLDRGIPIETSEERRKRVLQALGVPEKSIVLLPDIVLSTTDEARVFARWAEGQPIRAVLIVTSSFHTARSRLTFRRVLRDRGIEVRVYPSRLARYRSDTWWQSRDTLREGIIEAQKLLYYYLFETSAV